MVATVVPGSANRDLAEAVAATLGVEAGAVETAPFPDGERRLRVPELRGTDVYVVQPTCPPVDEHIIELLLLLDACRRAGADRVSAVVPYFGYARQDRRSRPVPHHPQIEICAVGGLLGDAIEHLHRWEGPGNRATGPG